MPPGDSGDLYRRPEPGYYETLRDLEERSGSASGGFSLATKVGIGVAVVAVFGSLGAAFVGDHHAEQSPQDVLNAFVQAALSANDDHAAAKLTCRAPHLDSFGSWQHDLAARRQRFDLSPLQADVAAYSDTKTDKTVTATTRVSVTVVVNGQPQERQTRPYTFTLTHEDGWKVCTATDTQ